MFVLEKLLRQEQFPEDTEKKLLNFIKAMLAPRYAEFIGNEIQKAYLESYSDYGQNLFERYISLADAWIEDADFKDPDTGTLMSRDELNAELTKIEKPAGIANPKDFRNEVVKFALRAKARDGGTCRAGPPTRKSARSSSGACSARSRTCCRSSPSAPRKMSTPSASTATSSPA